MGLVGGLLLCGLILDIYIELYMYDMSDGSILVGKLGIY
mgnify:CR=1 FL=1|jgi:hypothetical protein